MPATRSPINRTLRALRRHRTLRVALVAALLIVMIALDRSGLLLHRSDMQRYDGRTFGVVRVIDGDTLVIAAADGRSRTTRVRLWGIDAPELAKQDPPTPAEPFADEARAMARRLCEGAQVTLHLEPHRVRGNYGRLLAHVQLDDGTVLNEALLAAGLARFEGRFMHDRFDRYRQVAQAARDTGAGLHSE